MASLLFAAGLLTHSALKTHHQKRKTRHAHQTTTFTTLERENAARIANLQSTTGFCHHSDWHGAGCEPPLYTHHGDEGTRLMPPEYRDENAPHAPLVAASQSGGGGYVYRRGREVGVLAARAVGGGVSGMDEEEVRRINVERRKGGKRGGFSRFVRRWRRDRRA